MPADFDATRHLMSTAQADWDDHIGRRKPPCRECERLRAENLKLNTQLDHLHAVDDEYETLRAQRDALLALLKETIPQLSIYDGLRSRVHAAIDAAKARDRD